VSRDFLSDADRERLSSFPRPVSEQDLIQFFTLTSSDVGLIMQRRGEHNRVGYALQICTLRFLGFVPDDLMGIDRAVLEYLGRQLQADFRSLKEYAAREQTRSDHLQEIQAHLGYMNFCEGKDAELLEWLSQRAMEHDRPTVLLEQATGWLRSRKIIRPGISVLERIVGSARVRAEMQTFELLKPQLTLNMKRFLERLRLVRPGDDETYLQWLLPGESSNSPKSILSMLEKLEFLKKNRIHRISLSVLNPNRRKLLAQTGRRATSQAIGRMAEQKRYPVILCFLAESLEDITDDLLDMYDRVLAGIHSKSKNDLIDFRLESARTTDEKLRMLNTIGRLILNHGIADIGLRSVIFSHVEKKSLQAAVLDCGRLSRPKDNSVWDFFAARYSQIRQFSPKFIEILRFQHKQKYDGLMKALYNLRMVDAGHWPSLPHSSPGDFITSTWEPFVFAEDGTRVRRYYELCALWELRSGLRSGEIWVEHSKRHSNPETWLIPPDVWPSVRREYLALIRFPDAWREKRDTCRAEYLSAIPTLQKELRSGLEIRLDDDDRLIVTPYAQEDPSDSVVRLQSEITARIPQVELTDLLIETDSWLSFSDCFTHAGGEAHRLPDFRKRAYVSLFAGACNLESTRIAGQANLSNDQLRWFTTWFIREETLQAAINRTVNEQFRNPFSRHFGTGMMSSSDGQRFPVPVNSRNAVALPRYFGYGRGLTYYTWTSDQFSQYGVKVIPTTMRDATYVFDAICGNETDLPVTEHTTDTAGHTALVFALADLLGIEFSPRIRDIADQRLLRLDGVTAVELGQVQALMRKSARVREHLIEKHWDEILRVGASVKMGYVTSSLLISRLQAFPRQSGLVAALMEYGRLRKTIFILRYLGSQKYRRHIGKQLNKGESLHSLRSFIAFGKEGQIRKSSLESQTEQAGNLTLLTNLVILWNTRYIEQIVETLRKEGWLISDADISQVSPCRFEHINRYGKFSFDFENMPGNGQLRPLRSSEKIP